MEEKVEQELEKMLNSVDSINDKFVNDYFSDDEVDYDKDEVSNEEIEEDEVESFKGEEEHSLPIKLDIDRPEETQSDEETIDDINSDIEKTLEESNISNSEEQEDFAKVIETSDDDWTMPVVEKDEKDEPKKKESTSKTKKTKKEEVKEEIETKSDEKEELTEEQEEKEEEKSKPIMISKSKDEVDIFDLIDSSKDGDEFFKRLEELDD